MKTIISILALLIISLSISAQTSIKKDCISTGGNSVTNSNIKIVYTVGELAVQENSYGSVHISEGFISSDLMQITELKNYSQNNLNATVFPNPATDYIFITISNTESCNIQLFNLNGKTLILNKQTQETTTKINLTGLAPGAYLLIVRNDKLKEYKSFKIIKK